MSAPSVSLRTVAVAGDSPLDNTAECVQGGLWDMSMCGVHERRGQRPGHSECSLRDSIAHLTDTSTLTLRAQWINFIYEKNFERCCSKECIDLISSPRARESPSATPAGVIDLVDSMEDNVPLMDAGSGTDGSVAAVELSLNSLQSSMTGALVELHNISISEEERRVAGKARNSSSPSPGTILAAELQFSAWLAQWISRYNKPPPPVVVPATTSVHRTGRGRPRRRRASSDTESDGNEAEADFSDYEPIRQTARSVDKGELSNVFVLSGMDMFAALCLRG